MPTGYSFNLDGTAIYLTMASLFIAAGMGVPMSIPEQIGLLLFMVIASKGAAGVTGAGLATLAGGLQAFRPDLVNGVGVIVGLGVAALGGCMVPIEFFSDTMTKIAHLTPHAWALDVLAERVADRPTAMLCRTLSTFERLHPYRSLS